MGLDMYLYYISKSEREEGFRFDPKYGRTLASESLIHESDFDRMPETIKKNATKGIVLNRYFDLAAVVRDMLPKLSKDTVLDRTGSSCRHDEMGLYHNSFSYIIDMSDDVAIADGEYEVEKDENMRIVFNIKKELKYYHIEVEYREICPNGIDKYSGKYLVEKEEVMYSYIIHEAAYQRKGLNDYGWSIMPENCEYSDDFAVIKKMCKKGGLNKSFTENWIEGETVFFAWW